MCFFFYGTLLDADVRRAVIGPLAERLTPEPARLSGWQRVRLAGRSYPVIVRRVGRAVEGSILRGLPASAVVRLRRFETAEYRLARLEVLTDVGPVTARAFVGSGLTRPTSRPWCLEAWAQRHKVDLLRRLRRTRGRYRDSPDGIPPTSIGRLRPSPDRPGRSGSSCSSS